MKQPLPPKPQAMLNTAPDIAATNSIAASASAQRRSPPRSRRAPQSVMQNNIRVIQGALNRIGYGPFRSTVRQNEETVDAIRRFELDNGLPVSGEANDDVIARLIAIGAIKAT